MDFLAWLGAVATGSLGTLVLRSFLDRRTESRGARRAFYTELLTMMVNRRRVTERVSWNVDGPVPDDIDEDLIDRFDAGLLIDATPEVRERARECFKLLQRFWASYTVGVPVSVDEHGSCDYKFREMHELEDDEKRIAMRISLGAIHDELVVATPASSTRNLCCQREASGLQRGDSLRPFVSAPCPVVRRAPFQSYMCL